MRSRFFFVLAVLWAVPLVAQGDFYFVDGDLVEGIPAMGDNLTPGYNSGYDGLAILETPEFAWSGGSTFLEDQLPGPGVFGRGMPPRGPLPVDLAPGELLTTHLLHFELPEGVDGPHDFHARVIFDAEIVAILWQSGGLWMTDMAPVGASFRQPGDAGRQLELLRSTGDQIRRGADNLTIELDLVVGPTDLIDQVRVVTLATPPDGRVFIDCLGRMMTADATSVTFQADLVNMGTEPSLPVALYVEFTPPRAVPPPTVLTYEGSPRTCDAMSPLTCGIGRIDVGNHPTRAVIDGTPGETIGVDVTLIGANTTGTSCHFEATIPDAVPVDAGPGADAGSAPPPPPGDVIPTFGGGGGCVCDVGSSAPTPWGLLIVAAWFVAWRRRR